MQFTLRSTGVSNIFFTASVVLVAWTAVAQGAAIDAKKARSVIVDVAKDGLSRRVNVPEDTAVDLSDPEGAVSRAAAIYFLASDLERKETEGDDLVRRADPPAADAWYFAVDVKK